MSTFNIRLGVDIQATADGVRSGLYTHMRHLVYELRQLNHGTTTLFAEQSESARHNPEYTQELSHAFDGASVKIVRFPGRRLYRFFPHLAPLRRVDVLLHNVHSRLSPDLVTTNVFLIPDVIPIAYDFCSPDLVSFYRRYYDTAANRAAMIIVSSGHTKADFLARVGGDSERIRVCPLAPGPEFAPPNSSEAVRKTLATIGLADCPYILCVGTIEKRKNHAVLARAFARLLRSDPHLPHRLVFVGGTYIGHEEVFTLIDNLGLTDRFTYLGFTGNLPHLYAGASAFVFPSLYEGFGLPPLEAMACGTAVLSSSATSLPEVVGDGAIQFDPSDDAELARLLRQVIDDDNFRQNLISRGLARARCFSWRETARLYLAVCFESLDRSGRQSLVGSGRRP